VIAHSPNKRCWPRRPPERQAWRARTAHPRSMQQLAQPQTAHRASATVECRKLATSVLPDARPDFSCDQGSVRPEAFARSPRDKTRSSSGDNPPLFERKSGSAVAIFLPMKTVRSDLAWRLASLTAIVQRRQESTQATNDNVRRRERSPRVLRVAAAEDVPGRQTRRNMQSVDCPFATTSNRLSHALNNLQPPDQKVGALLPHQPQIPEAGAPSLRVRCKTTPVWPEAITTPMLQASQEAEFSLSLDLAEKKDVRQDKIVHLDLPSHRWQQQATTKPVPIAVHARRSAKQYPGMALARESLWKLQRSNPWQKSPLSVQRKDRIRTRVFTDQCVQRIALHIHAQNRANGSRIGGFSISHQKGVNGEERTRQRCDPHPPTLPV